MSYAVAIEPYDPQWPQKFDVEVPLIRQAMGEVVVDVQHIGSTCSSVTTCGRTPLTGRLTPP